MTLFRWDNLTPPISPAQVTADLEESGMPPLQVVTVRFAWPLDLADPVGTTFDIHLRWVALPRQHRYTGPPGGRFERAEGTFAPALVFPSDFSGTTTHDGTSVAVSSVDETRTTPSGPQLYRNFEVRAAGVVIAYDGGHDRAQAWVTVGSRNAKGVASVDLGGRAKAEHFRVLLLCNPTSGSTFPIGTTTIECKATDDAGNTDTGSFDIMVEDNNTPTPDDDDEEDWPPSDERSNSCCYCSL